LLRQVGVFIYRLLGCLNR